MAAEIVKLLSTAEASNKKAEQGDKAEEQRGVDVLKVLGKTAVTAALLAETEAGKKVKKLSKSTVAAIAEAAAATMEAWKNAVRNEKVKPKEEPTPAAGDDADQAAQDLERRGSEADAGPSSKDGSQSTGMAQRSASACLQDLPKPKRCGDDTRDKIRGFLAEALAWGLVDADLTEKVYADRPASMAVEIEEAMYDQAGRAVNAKYKAKYRSLSFNLKDPNNPGLRVRVLHGEIPGQLLVNLSAEELASEDRRSANNAIRDHMKRECERGQTQQASTDMFQCGRCKQRKTTYYQMQTRSADEPMTTFVSCVNCGNRWKFC